MKMSSFSFEPLLPLDMSPNLNFVSARITPRVWVCFAVSTYNFNDRRFVVEILSKILAAKKKKVGLGENQI